ncbi:MAG: thioredoxin family protein [Piscirickettsiaceae bacterium]|nr:MAG: thioredoxin family protein [Piscirickettsiaceae bacterium]PCI72474.1 MAG: thioredoxin family protein [Piscirickettsiaceae bacterium]
MTLVHTPICDVGLAAPDFNLQGVDGKQWSRDDCAGENGLLVMFICNHCPYVKAIQKRLVEDAVELQKYGIGVVAIMSNDPNDYLEDSFENMQIIAREKGYNFPYLIDTTQQIAKAYGAICTPDFFGYNAKMELQYRGRLDESGMKVSADDMNRDLLEAMKLIASTGQGPEEQIASMGCSIKWR